MLSTLGIAWGTALALSLALEATLRPRPIPFWHRPPATWAVHLGTVTLLFGTGILILQRPWLTTGILLFLEGVIVLVNNTKYASLHEPFVNHDFEYFTDAIRHPRLYIPFLGITLTIAVLVGAVLAISAALIGEPALGPIYGLPALLTSGLILVGLAILSLAAGIARLPRCSLDPEQDIRFLGLFSHLWAYGLRARQPLAVPEPPPITAPKPPAAGPLPHIVAIQSESFFDPRYWTDNIAEEILAPYDALAEQALCRGRLQVPAWGANTVRTECGFLTGLDPATLDVHRFNPYYQLARKRIPSLASHLQALGYRTVAIHPYPASFYQRDRVFPNLGFDAFIDDSAFVDTSRSGQYIADAAVAQETARQIEEEADQRPLFLFVITMENHGPLHLETPEPGDAARLHRYPPPAGCEPFTVFLKHLENAAHMGATVANQLTQAQRPGFLCWYGDHVPILPEAYRRLGMPDGLTDYFLWSTSGAHQQTPPPRQDRRVEELPNLLLHTI